MAFLSIRLVVTMLCGVAIIISGGVALGVTMAYTLQAAEDYATQYVSAISETGRRKILDFLGVPIGKVTGFQEAVAHGMLAQPVNATSAERSRVFDVYLNMFYTSMRETPLTTTNLIGTADATLIQCNTPDGTFIQCGTRDGRNTSVVGGRTVRAQYELTINASTGALISTVYSTTTYTPTTRSWYTISGTTPGTRTFSSRFITATFRKAVISLSGAVHSPTGGFVGTFGQFFRLDDLSTYLRELPQTKNAAVILLDNGDYVLGSSREASSPSAVWLAFLPWPALPAGYHAGCENVSSISLYYCPYPITTYPMGIFGELARAQPGLIANGSVTPLHLKLDSGRYFASVRAIQTTAAQNLNWRVVTLIPEDDITAEITKGRNLAIILVAVTIVVCVIGALLATWLLLRPLQAVAQRMYKAATFAALDDEEASEEQDCRAAPSVLAEVATIQKAFAALSDQVRRARQYLPAALLAPQGSDEGGDEDDDEADGSESEPLSAVRSQRSSVQMSRRTSGTRHTGDESSARGGTGSRHHHNSSADDRSASSKGSSLRGRGSVAGVAAAAVTALRSDLGLTRRKATVLYANIRQFHAKIAATGTDSVVTEYGPVVDLVTKLATQQKGILDAFHGDRFVVTFNAARPCGSHASGAALTALGLLQSSLGVQFTAGAASGLLSVGNLGSRSSRRFHTIGEAFSRAVLLERLCPILGAPLLMTRLTAADAELAVHTLAVDALPSAPGSDAAAAAAGLKLQGLSVATALRPRTNTGADDEWMYELQAGAKEPTGLLSEAVQMLTDGDFSGCEAQLNAFRAATATTTTASSPVANNAARGSRNASVSCGAAVASAAGTTASAVVATIVARLEQRLSENAQGKAAAASARQGPVTALGVSLSDFFFVAAGMTTGGAAATATAAGPPAANVHMSWVKHL